MPITLCIPSRLTRVIPLTDEEIEARFGLYFASCIEAMGTDISHLEKMALNARIIEGKRARRADTRQRKGNGAGQP